MPRSSEELASLVKGHLTASEVAGGAAYAVDGPVAAGTQLAFPKVQIAVPWEAWLVFVDRDPAANWSHSCRYLLVHCETGEARSFEAQLPPFRPGGTLRWRLVFKAPGVPDGVLRAL